MKFFVLSCGLLLIVPAIAQEHAPTAAQCQADLAIWGSLEDETEYLEAQTAHLNEGTPNRTDANKVGYKEISARKLEMDYCTRVDPPNSEKYVNVTSFYSIVQEDRMDAFLRRHNLWPQFFLEDSQGKR